MAIAAGRAAHDGRNAVPPLFPTGAAPPLPRLVPGRAPPRRTEEPGCPLPPSPSTGEGRVGVPSCGSSRATPPRPDEPEPAATEGTRESALVQRIGCLRGSRDRPLEGLGRAGPGPLATLLAGRCEAGSAVAGHARSAASPAAGIEHPRPAKPACSERIDPARRRRPRARRSRRCHGRRRGPSLALRAAAAVADCGDAPDRYARGAAPPAASRLPENPARLIFPQRRSRRPAGLTSGRGRHIHPRG
jgi:hypothetical protein